MNLNFFSLFFIFMVNIFSVEAYVFQINDNGKILRWPRYKKEIYFWADNNGNADVSSSQLLDYASEVASGWNDADVPKLTVKKGPGFRTNSNDIVFSHNGLYFSGNSVLAITQVTFQEATGRILETDIILRDTNGFRSDLDKKEYFESLLAHEMGHALGLDHGQVHNSTMFYSFGKRQRTLHTDDVSGAKVLYHQEDIGTGEISGVIAGGNSEIGVFGAHVQAISSLTGKVVSGAITGENGFFTIGNLPLDDVYFLYVGPTHNLPTLSRFYENIQSNFCSNGGNYRGSFFQSCGSTRQGYPQGILLDEDKNVGVVTVRCGLNIPKNYLAKRSNSDFVELNLDENNGGDAITGFFSQADISNRRSDRLRIDLSNLNLSRNDLFFEIKLLSQDLYSIVKWDMRVDTPAGTRNYTNFVDSDGNPELNLISRIALDSFNPGNNVFDITITPSDFLDFISNDPFSSEDYFPSIQNFGGDAIFYLLIVNISQSTISGHKLYSHYNYGPLQDNSECMDANKTFAVKSSRFAASKFPSRNDEQENSGMTCGNIFFNGGGKGPGQVFFSLFIGFLVIFLGFWDYPFKKHFWLN